MTEPITDEFRERYLEPVLPKILMRDEREVSRRMADEAMNAARITELRDEYEKLKRLFITSVKVLTA